MIRLSLPQIHIIVFMLLCLEAREASLQWTECFRSAEWRIVHRARGETLRSTFIHFSSVRRWGAPVMDGDLFLKYCITSIIQGLRKVRHTFTHWSGSRCLSPMTSHVWVQEREELVFTRYWLSRGNAWLLKQALFPPFTDAMALSSRSSRPLSKRTTRPKQAP